MARDIFERLKAPEALQKKVSLLCKEHMFLPEKDLSDKALRRLIHRSVDDMDRLFTTSAFGRGTTTIDFEEEGVNLFATCERQAPRG